MLRALDETASREHAYTAVSRGRHSNDLFVASADRREEERHAPEEQSDPISQLRTAVRRRSAQRFALGELEAGIMSQLDQLRHERDLLRLHLSYPPPDPSGKTRALLDERVREQQHRDRALWRRNLAQGDLDRLGPVGRRTRPARRRRIESRVAHFDVEIAKHDVKLADLDRRLAVFAPAVARRRAWERHHGVELSRLEGLDRRIELIERLDQITMRSFERGVGVEF